MRPQAYTASISLILASLLSPIVRASTSSGAGSVNCSDSISQIEIIQGSGDSSVINYSWDNAIDVTCPAQDYLVTFDIDQTSDIYFAISTQKTLLTGSDVIEGVIGVNTGTWYIGSSVYSKEEDVMSGAADTQKIYVQIDSSGVNIGLVGSSTPVLTLSSSDYDVSTFTNSPTVWLAFGAENDSAKVQNVAYSCNESTCVSPSSTESSSAESSSTESSSTDSSSTESSSTEPSSTDSSSTESNSTESSSTESSSTEPSSTESSSTESSSTESSSTESSSTESSSTESSSTESSSTDSSSTESSSTESSSIESSSTEPSSTESSSTESSSTDSSSTDSSST
ncbi:hypothetical protein AX774_g4240, partial [Zancudomyces culisetae]